MKTRKKSLTVQVSEHKSKYDRCYKCEIGKQCTSRIYYRGVLPSDIVILGESAGDTDWVLGKPFSGNAGKLLDQMIAQVFGTKDLATLASTRPAYRISMTNSVACITQNLSATKLRPPTNTELKNCASRLDDFLDIANPRVIIAVGKTAERQATKNLNYNYHIIPMIHPNTILRQEERGELDYKRVIHSLQQAKEYVTP